jgi:hypothetical protein
MALLQKAYLGATPLFKERSWYEDVSAIPVNASSVVTVTANTSAHTKGAWTELIASTSGNASYIIIECGVDASIVDTATLLDIGTGASGSETGLISNVAVGSAARMTIRAAFAFGVPIKIPSGTRLSARIQSIVTGGKTGTIVIRTFNMGDYGSAPTAVDVIGVNTATSQGTAMSGSSGTYVEITASTANDYRGIVIVPSASSNNIGTISTEFILAKGAASSEVELGRTIVSYVNTEQVGMNSFYPPIIGGFIPSGTRLSVAHDIALGPGAYDVTLIGIR